MSSAVTTEQTDGVSVIMPAADEERSVAEVVRDVALALSDSDHSLHEVIVVDDGSEDGTAAAAAGARVIRHPYRAGYGRALKSGIQGESQNVIYRPTKSAVLRPATWLIQCDWFISGRGLSEVRHRRRPW